MNLNSSKFLKSSAAPLALGLALIAGPAFAQDAKPVDTADIVVTGTRIISPNLRSATPITSVTNADIKLSGVTKAEDLLNQLPQVFAAQSSGISNGATGTAEVNLRDLGPQRTLVLINGRRMGSGDPIDVNPDVNFIPVSLLKRVDITTGGASAQYGADAVAGVVNFVMDTDLEGFRIDVNNGFYQHDNGNKYMDGLLDAQTAKGNVGYSYPKGSSLDGDNVDASIAWGHKLGGGAGHIEAYFTYRRAAAITQNQRDYSSCSLSGTSCGGSHTSSNIIYTPAGASSSTYGSLGGGKLIPNKSNVYNFAPTNYFQRPDERYTAGIFADYEVSPAFHPYREFMFMADHSLAQIAPSGDFGNTLTLNCDNPLLTAQEVGQLCQSSNLVAPNTAEAIILKRNTEGGPRIDDLNHLDFRQVLGTKGDIGHGWHYDLYYQYWRAAYHEAYYNDVSVRKLTNALDVVSVNGTPTCQSVVDGSDKSCVPYDIFSGNGVSSAALNYIEGVGKKSGFTSENVVSGTLSGDLGTYGFKSPWAKDGIQLAVGGEYRREALRLNTDLEFSTGDLAGQGGATLPTSLSSYHVVEGFAEVSVPIMQDGLFHEIALDGSYRYSHYGLQGNRTYGTNTWGVQLTAAPTTDITFRGSINRAVRSPNLLELFTTDHVSLDSSVSADPCAGFQITAADTGCIAQGLKVGQTVIANSSGQYNGLQGGNPALSPEVAITKTLGVILTPSSIRGLSLSVDYFNIKVKDSIGGIGAQVILDDCSSGTNLSFCSLVHRDPATGSLWLTTNGYVTDVDQNIGYVQTAGYDFALAYNHHFLGKGTLSASLDGVVTDKLVTYNGVSAAYDCVGYYGVRCGSPEPVWRHKARVTFTGENGIGLSVAWRYMGPVDADANNPVLGGAGSYTGYGAHIGSQSYFDLGFTAKVNSELSFRAGVNNMLDKDPPLVTTTNCQGVYCNGNTYPGAYDALGRYIYTGLTMNF